MPTPRRAGLGQLYARLLPTQPCWPGAQSAELHLCVCSVLGLGGLESCTPPRPQFCLYKLRPPLGEICWLVCQASSASQAFQRQAWPRGSGPRIVISSVSEFSMEGRREGLGEGFLKAVYMSRVCPQGRAESGGCGGGGESSFQANVRGLK